MTRSAWKQEILTAIEMDGKGEVGRAGETTLTRLADTLEKLSPGSDDAENALHALIDLIAVPSIVTIEPGAYWQGLVFLSQYIPYINNQELITAFRLKLSRREKLTDELKATVLLGLIAASGKVSLQELRSLSSIRKVSSLIWINAAVQSGFFEKARRETLKLLRSKKINTNILILHLDSWNKVWKGKDFTSVVTEFARATPSSKARRELLNWMKIRDKNMVA